jgi:hypothetical protein
MLKCILVVNISQLWSFDLSGANLQNMTMDTYNVLALIIRCITSVTPASVSVGTIRQLRTGLGRKMGLSYTSKNIYMTLGLGEVRLVLWL